MGGPWSDRRDVLLSVALVVLFVVPPVVFAVVGEPTGWWLGVLAVGVGAFLLWRWVVGFRLARSCGLVGFAAVVAAVRFVFGIGPDPDAVDGSRVDGDDG